MLLSDLLHGLGGGLVAAALIVLGALALWRLEEAVTARAELAARLARDVDAVRRAATQRDRWS